MPYITFVLYKSRNPSESEAIFNNLVASAFLLVVKSRNPSESKAIFNMEDSGLYAVSNGS